jgi:serine/threonine-protein kinase
MATAFAISSAPPMPPTEAAALQLPVDQSFAATQQGPLGMPAADVRTTPPQPWWRRRQVQLGLAAAVVVILAAGVGIIGYLVWPASTSRSAATSQPSATVRQITPVAEPALQGLLLTPDQIDATMGTTGTTVTETTTVMEDNSDHVADKSCRPLAGNVIAPVYAGSGWRAFREQVIREPGDKWTHGVDQGVVLFSSAHDAGAFFAASAQQWPACANRQFTTTVAGKPNQVWTVGPVSNASGVLSATDTRNVSPGWDWESCQRALTVANNVAIDVEACNLNPSDSQANDAVNIVNQIAANVPG